MTEETTSLILTMLRRMEQRLDKLDANVDAMRLELHALRDLREGDRT